MHREVSEANRPAANEHEKAQL
jgi:hypothetical protein